MVQATSVERRIRFYRLRVQRSGQRPPDPDYGFKVIEEVNRLRRADGEHELELDDGRLLVAEGIQHAGYAGFAFGAVRKSALPQLYSSGKAQDLSLAAQDGLVDVTHFIIFPDGVVGTEVNRFGPSFAQFPRYVHTVLKEFRPRVKAGVLIQPDTLAALQRLQQITLAEMEISKSRAEIVKRAHEAEDVWDVFRAAGDQFGGEQVKVTVRPEQVRQGRTTATRRRFLDSSAVARLRRWALRDDVRSAVDSFTIKGFDPAVGQQVTLDLLDQKLISRKTVTGLGPSRVVVRADMFNRIIEAHAEMQVDIDLASDLVFSD